MRLTQVKPARAIIALLLFPEILEDSCPFHRIYSLNLVFDHWVLKQFNGTDEPLEELFIDVYGVDQKVCLNSYLWNYRSRFYLHPNVGIAV